MAVTEVPPEAQHLTPPNSGTRIRIESYVRDSRGLRQTPVGRFDTSVSEAPTPPLCVTDHDLWDGGRWRRQR